ncbi:hypothetical protein RJ639_024562, partial [Escallonia herrerae]
PLTRAFWPRRRLHPSRELTIEERNLLLSVAFKNLIGSLLAAWRSVSSIEHKDESQKKDDYVALDRDYRSNVVAKGNTVAVSVEYMLSSYLAKTYGLQDRASKTGMPGKTCNVSGRQFGCSKSLDIQVMVARVSKKKLKSQQMVTRIST